jgi:hypothetical protein
LENFPAIGMDKAGKLAILLRQMAAHGCAIA